MDVARHLSAHGPVARRADLLRAGFGDRAIRAALAAHTIFRVRHGWYARTGTAEAVIRAVRVGGQVTGIEALRLRGLFLPLPARVDIAVPHNAARLRRPDDMRRHLLRADPVRIHWVTARRGDLRSRDWLATEDDAVLVVLRTASRGIAVAACDGLVRYRGWTAARLDAAFARAPQRVRAWRALVDGRSDSWGESVVRLRLQDAGVACDLQARLGGVGPFDLRVAPGVVVEIDGAQHDESWAGADPSSFERDHLKDLGLARIGARSIRITYAMFERDWGACLDAIRVAIEVDARSRRPRKLRRSPSKRSPRRAKEAIRPNSPEF